MACKIYLYYTLFTQRCPIEATYEIQQKYPQQAMPRMSECFGQHCFFKNGCCTRAPDQQGIFNGSEQKTFRECADVSAALSVAFHIVRSMEASYKNALDPEACFS